MSIARGPKCPNHGVPLVKTNDPGIGICPVSDAKFAYDADEFEKTKKAKIDKFGQKYHEGDWNVKHIEGQDV